jgi:thiamine biosynthesis lipoprotein
VNEHRFDAMGCEIFVAGDGPLPTDDIERLFRDRERLFSRFLSDSEINQVNARTGHVVSVSREFAHTLTVALQIAEQTEGMVDPTIGGALEAAGYTRDFALLRPDAEPPGPSEPGVWRSALLVGRRLHVPPGVRIDLNGVVKALAVDDALAMIPSHGFVSAGGDLAARGELTVALPDGEPVALRRGALATSGRSKRVWIKGGALQHHLIDPRTGSPSESLWEQVTACGANCLAADAAAKAGFLLGEHGPAWLDARGIPARFLDREGAVTTNESWQQSMAGADAAACI